MSRAAALHFLCAFGVFQKGLSGEVQTERTVVAALGRDAHFSCELTQHKDVHQVTWQKLLSDDKKTVATCTKSLGQRVSADFKGKVEFIDAGLQNSSIVIREVTELDEGCYRCLFATYPQGALTGTTCLQVYELHGPVLNVTQSNSTEEVMVSCSATARPAPTVTLRVLGHDVLFTKHSSASLEETNGLVTTTDTAVLPSVREGSTQVGCAVRVLSGPPSEVFMMIPEVKQSPAEGFDESNYRGRSSLIVVPVIVAFACALLAALIISRFKQRNQNSQSHSVLDDNEMPHATIGDIHKTRESLLTLENDQIRQRTTPMKDQVNPEPNPSPSATRRILT